MQGVDFAQVMGQSPDKRVAAQPAQAVLIMQFTDDDGRGRIDVLRQAEHSALGDGHRPDLPGPLIDVTENPVMDLPQVRQVVAGSDGRLVQQDQGRMSDLPLRVLKVGRHQVRYVIIGALPLKHSKPRYQPHGRREATRRSGTTDCNLCDYRLHCGLFRHFYLTR